MELTPRDKDKLLLFTAALLAERRKAKGLKLNYPESIALISAEILEGAREGLSVAELMGRGAEVLTRDDVMEGIAEMIPEVQEGDLPGWHQAGDRSQPHRVRRAIMIPGEYLVADGEISLCEDRLLTTLSVGNTGDRPIQIGSHYHFAEANPALVFDREAALGQRLDIAAGTAIRFEPGQTRDVTLIPFAGSRHIYGFRGEVMGQLKDDGSVER